MQQNGKATTFILKPLSLPGQSFPVVFRPLTLLKQAWESFSALEFPLPRDKYKTMGMEQTLQPSHSKEQCRRDIGFGQSSTDKGDGTGGTLSSNERRLARAEGRDLNPSIYHC